MRILAEPVEATVRREPLSSAPPAESAGSTLERIRERGALRVGYVVDGLPFAFFNGRDELVGYDVDIAYRLARDLGVKLELAPVEREHLVEAIRSRSSDLIIGGIAVTAERAEQLAFSSSYMDETLAFIVPDHRREEFADWETIRSRTDLVLAGPNVPYYLDKVRELAPSARIETFEEIEPLLAGGIPGADAIIGTAERGSTWTLLYPKFTVVVPEPRLVKIPLAYPLSQDDERWRDYLDVWLDLKRKDGTLDALYRYWILGQDAVPKVPRWSVIRDVLHWVD